MSEPLTADHQNVLLLLAMLRSGAEFTLKAEWADSLEREMARTANLALEDYRCERMCAAAHWGGSCRCVALSENVALREVERNADSLGATLKAAEALAAAVELLEDPQGYYGCAICQSDMMNGHDAGCQYIAVRERLAEYRRSKEKMG